MEASKNSAELEKLHQIKMQIEYYLSDENLKNDQFFHQNISTDPNGYLSLKLIMKCNKIIKAGYTKEQITAGIKLSNELELDVDNEKVRRKGNKQLPELKLLNNKRKKEKEPEDEDNLNRDFDEDKDRKCRDKDQEKTYDPIILQVNSENEAELKWKKILDEFTSLNPNLEVVYGRFNKTEGHFGIFNKPNTELSFIENFEIASTKFSVKRCEGEDLINFWTNHGSHYELCTKNSNNPKEEKRKVKKFKRDDTSLKNPVKLGDEIYVDITQIKSNARRILTTNKDGEQLQTKDEAFLLDLLKFHKNGEEKIRDMDYITTGKPSEYEYSRCFFIIKEGGRREDFSVQKCIEMLENKNKKK